MNKAMEILFEEHSVIVTAVDLVKKAKVLIGNNNSLYEKSIRELITFFRKYADEIHHRKEEEVLFPEMQKKNEILAGGILHEMLENHGDFRKMISKIEINLNEKKYSEAQSLLEKYGEMLLDHIAVENEEVFQMPDSLFSDDELDKMYFRFRDCDDITGLPGKHLLENSLKEIEKRLISES